MKKLLAIMLSAVMVLGLCVFTASADTAISIGTYDQLVAWASGSDTTSNVTLTADITATADWTTPKADFSGTFDGAGYSISGLNGTQGLFTKVTGATIKNLSIVDSTINGGGGIAIFAANVAGDVKFVDCYTNSSITGSGHNVAAFVASTSGAPSVTFEGCWFDGDVTCALRYVSGFLANNQSKDAFFTNCLSTGNVTSNAASADGQPIIGAFAGAAYNGVNTFTNCLASAGSITVGSDWTTTGGGVFSFRSYKDDSFTSCYAVSGIADHLWKEGEAGLNSVSGKVEWIDANAVTAELMGSGWGLDDQGTVVPAAFATQVSSSEILIGTADELVAWAADSSDNAGQTVKLTADIALTADWTPKANFAGTFDGQGYTISDLKGAQGLITKVTDATIQNLFIIDAEITASAGPVGSVAGTCAGTTTVKNVYSNAKISVTGTNAGGIIGHGTYRNSNPTTFESCWFDGEITVSGTGRYASGIFGNQESSVVITTDCLSTGSVSGVKNLAGISNAIYSGKLDATRCVNAGPVIASDASAPGSAIADTVGENNTSLGAYAKLVNCYAVKDMQGSAGVRDLRSNNTDASAEGEALVVDDLAALADCAGLADTWATNGKGLMVPAYFAKADLGPEVSTEPAVEGDIVIKTWDELVAWAADISSNEDKTVALGADITAPSGSSYTPKNSFAGTFDGNGYTISGLNVTGDSGLGFIKTLSGTVKNLFIKDSTFAGTASGHGSVAAYATGEATVENVYSNAAVSGINSMGGIIGDLSSGATLITVTGCWFDGTVTASGSYSSGIVGNQESRPCVITDCLNTGTVNCKKNENNSGISTAVYDGSLIATRCINLGPVTTGTTEDAGNLGCAICETVTNRNGLVGEATLVDCYSLAGSARPQPVDIRGAAKLTGTVTEVASADALNAEAVLAETWGLTDDDQIVPKYFATKELSGSAEEPVELTEGDINIHNWDELVAWAADSDTNEGKVVAILADITAPTGASWSPKAEFAGTLEGNGLTISGLTGAQGLIRKATGATIQKLSIVDSTISGEGGVAAFAAYAAGDVKFIDCYTNATVSGTSHNVAAFVASTDGEATVAFEGCWFDGDITCAVRYVSGFIANNQSKNVSFKNCLSTGNVTSNADTAAGQPIIGAFAGAGYDGLNTFENCYASAGLITITTDWTAQGGGVFAFRSYKADEFTNCYAVVGIADHLWKEGDSGKESVTGKVEWVDSADKVTAQMLGEGWGVTEDDGLVVPIAFGIPVEPEEPGEQPPVEEKTLTIVGGDKATVEEGKDYELALEGETADLKVSVDNKELAADQFTLSGTKLTIKAAALGNLFYGSHSVKVASGDLSATATFTLVAGEEEPAASSSDEAPASSDVPASSESNPSTGGDELKIVEENPTVEEGKDLELTVEGEIPEGYTVTVDGKELTSEQYEIVEGKLVIKAAFLATLEDGEHSIVIGTADNAANAKFTVGAVVAPTASASASASATAQPSASNAPKTADGITIFMIVALILSAGAFVVVSKARARG